MNPRWKTVEDHIGYDFISDRMYTIFFLNAGERKRKHKQLHVQCLNFIYFNEPCVSHCNWCENGEWQSVGTKALMNVSVWPYNELGKFWFFPVKVLNSRYLWKIWICFWSYQVKIINTLDHPKKPWECMHLLLEMLIGEIPWKVQQQKVVLIIFNEMRTLVSFTLIP